MMDAIVVIICVKPDLQTDLIFYISENGSSTNVSGEYTIYVILVVSWYRWDGKTAGADCEVSPRLSHTLGEFFRIFRKKPTFHLTFPLQPTRIRRERGDPYAKTIRGHRF